MRIDGFTWFGLGVAAVGWAVMIADAALSPFLMAGGSIAATAVMRSDIFTIAQTAIVSGFGLAIIGALRAGFGALNGFFDAVLQRAGAPRPSPVVTPEPVEVTEPTVEVPRPPAPPVHPPNAPHTLPAVPAKPQRERGRNYTILANGAVEVETLLGTRVFASLDEARDYIR